MSKYLTEMEELQAALAKCDYNSEVMPMRGCWLIENVEAHNKILKMLECDELVASHKYLYSLDPDEMTDKDATKVDKLYNLACDKGFIEPEVDNNDVNAEIAAITGDNATDEIAQVWSPGEDTEPTNTNVADEQVKTPIQPFVSKTYGGNAFKVMYSACASDGSIKTGEVFSNALNTIAAKADAVAKLEQAGYHSISILCIEAGDPDQMGITDIDVKPIATEDDILDGRAHNGHVAEDAILDNRSHNGHIAEDDDELDDQIAKEDETPEEFFNSVRSENDEVTEEADDEESEKTDDSDEEVEDADSEETDDADEEADDTEDSDDSELSAEEKETLKDEYKKAWKQTLSKIKAKTAFYDFDLETKINFFSELSKAWGDKPESGKFLSDKDNSAIEKMTLTK